MRTNILKVKKAMLSLFVVMLPLLVSAQTKVEINGIWYNLMTQSKVAEVTSGTSKYIGNIVIPSTVTCGNEVYKVTRIGEEAFYECVNLTAVTIPDGVTSIGYYAFDGCCNLQTIIIPNSVERIETGAFMRASGLTSITIPNRLKTIEVETFSYCSSLTSIVIPNSVISIEDEAFTRCSNLATVIMSDNIMYIGSEAFDETAWLNNQPDGVVYLGNILYCYKGTMPDNTYIEVKDGTVFICDLAFSQRAGLASISIPKSVKSIGGGAFEGTAWLNNQPDGAVYLGNILYCYKGTMPNNTSVSVKEGTISISGWAFEDCMGLVSIYIPESVTSIGFGAFEGCENLTSTNIPKGITRIEADTYHYCSKLSSITIPEGVTRIGRDAFCGCSSLTSITIPEGVVYISEYTFAGCTGLNSIIIPEGVTSIEEGAFDGCVNLTAVAIPEGVTNIGEDAFCGCSSLATIVIPQSVTSIGSSAFDETAWLNNQPDGVVYLNNMLYCYNGTMPDNTFVKVKEGTTSINDYALEHHRGLVSVLIPKSVTRIGYGAFEECGSLRDVYCYADDVPSTELNAFKESYPENATLYVPAKVLDSYKTTAPWSSFGRFEAIKMKVESIVLNQKEATLTEGETLTLTATVTPEDADDTSVTWVCSNEDVAMVSSKGKVIAIAPGVATITASANDGSGVMASCDVVVRETTVGKCAIPTVRYVDGKVLLACETEGVAFVTKVVSDNKQDYNDAEFKFIPTHTFTVYAIKEKFEDSDKGAFTLCWIPCNGEHEDEDSVDGILNIPSNPVLIQSQGGTITLSGLADDAEVAAYDLAGRELATGIASNGIAELATGLEVGNTAIVKIGDNNIKIVVK